MKSIFQFGYKDVLNEQKRQLEHLKAIKVNQMRQGLSNLDHINQRIAYAQRFIDLLSKYMREPQTDLFDFNTELNLKSHR